MIYFFINFLSYLICIMFLIFYFHKKINLFSFFLILFNINTTFFFLFLNYNAIYEVIGIIFTIMLYHFIKYFDKNKKEVILIQNGNINFHEVIKNYSYKRLLKYLNNHKLSLKEIEYCILYENHLTIIKKENV